MPKKKPFPLPPVDSVGFGTTALAHAASITYGNGSEKAKHSLFNETLQMRSYFCEPYHSWEKSPVENRNGLGHRFFPKRPDSDTIQPHAFQQEESWINNQPMI